MRQRRLPHSLNMDPFEFGHLLEGTLEQDPMTDRIVLIAETRDGKRVSIDLHEILRKYVGQDVRFTLASFANLEKLARLVEASGGGQVHGIQPEELPVPFNVVRKS